MSQQDVEQMLYSLFDVTSLDELGQPALLEAVKHIYSYAIFGEQRHRAVDLTVEQVEEFTTLLHTLLSCCGLWTLYSQVSRY